MDSVLLGICRMLDPAFGRGRRDKNLTPYSLLLLINDVALKSEFEQACNNAVIRPNSLRTIETNVLHIRTTDTPRTGAGRSHCRQSAGCGKRVAIPSWRHAVCATALQRYGCPLRQYQRICQRGRKLVAALRQLEWLKSKDGEGN